MSIRCRIGIHSIDPEKTFSISTPVIEGLDNQKQYRFLREVCSRCRRGRTTQFMNLAGIREEVIWISSWKKPQGFHPNERFAKK